MRYCIGIDGGGTKTEGVLTDFTGHVLARRVTGASNPNDITLPVAVETIAALAEALLADEGISPAEWGNVSLFGGIAGGINYRDGLEAGLRARLPAIGVVGIRSDIHILLSGELPTGNGACMICGTGSSCFLRRGQEIIRIGGWGYLLDSGGSGYDMGREALEAVLRAYDGRGEATLLTTLITAHLGGPVHTKITDIYREGKPYIAACAPLVFEAAAEGDAVADRILKRNARALAEYVETAWRWLLNGTEKSKSGIPTRLPVVMGGSISLHRADVWPSLVASLVDPAVPVELFVAKSPMVFGAVVEAVKQITPANGTVDFTALRNRFRAGYCTS